MPAIVIISTTRRSFSFGSYGGRPPRFLELLSLAIFLVPINQTSRTCPRQRSAQSPRRIAEKDRSRQAPADLRPSWSRRQAVDRRGAAACGLSSLVVFL